MQEHLINRSPLSRHISCGYMKEACPRSVKRILNIEKSQYPSTRVADRPNPTRLSDLRRAGRVLNALFTPWLTSFRHPLHTIISMSHGNGYPLLGQTERHTSFPHSASYVTVPFFLTLTQVCLLGL